jgi:polyphosphate kinase
MQWLQFNQRVLNEAEDPSNPLLERVKFLNIFASNLDEFFMKRVGGLKRQVFAQVASVTDVLAPADQLLEIRKAVLAAIQRYSDCLSKQIQPALKAEDIHLLSWSELTESERAFVNDFYRRRVFPVLTPLAVDPGHPFPFISNLSTSIGVLLKQEGTDEELFARVKVPDIFPNWIRVDKDGDDRNVRFVSLIEIVAANLATLFPGMEITDIMVFRVTRNADIERDEEDADDLLQMVAEELRERRFAKGVRLEHGPDPNLKILSLLREELELAETDIYEIPTFMESLALTPLYAVARPVLKFPVWTPVSPGRFSDPETNIFSLIREEDQLVHHPYESFSTTVERFIRSAVDDPNVLAIKMVLYRTGDDSPFIPLLIRAAEEGKQVVCLVELKARFDEERNIELAQRLEKAGVHVVYGVVGLKTHCKVTLVVRQEGENVRCYAHVGTGNYHTGTARLYTDFGFFTAREDITSDLVLLFHYLTGPGRADSNIYRKLIVAPAEMYSTFIRLIDREIDHVRMGRPGRIIAKMNALEDRGICRKLYEASQAGVKIDLIVRGFCTLKPGVAGLSENIRVTSVIGRFLEHSRVFYFGNGAMRAIDGEIFIGSADWMSRNLESRVEVVVPIEDRKLKIACCEVLGIMLSDQRQAWDMNSLGVYRRRIPSSSVELGTHARLMQLAKDRGSLTLYPKHILDLMLNAPMDQLAPTIPGVSETAAPQGQVH